MKEINDQLFAMQDLKYRAFHTKLIPTVDPVTVIGVRTPELRAYARSICKTETAAAFLHQLPHQYYDENNLHGFLIEQIHDFDACIEAIDVFLPYINNWATCDMIRPSCFRRNKERLLPHILRWLGSGRTYTTRYAIGMLLTHFLGDDFDARYPALVASVVSQEYYVNMMIAWYFATALAYQYDAIIPYLQDACLQPWVHNKTIQKAIESRRLTSEQKNRLRFLRVK